jgi:hypothetical protein|tara:strand:- start:10825 stop:11097 length:273 start_codon:yes stop_codon:yes gene_type:complete
MNKQDRNEMSKFSNRLENVEGDLKEILTILKDDPNSTNKGLLTRLNETEDLAHKANRQAQKLAKTANWVGGVLTAVLVSIIVGVLKLLYF